MPCAELVDVEAVVVAGRLAVEEHGEADRGARGRRREDEVEVARVEAERDRAAGGAEDGGLLLDGPVAGQRPVIERQLRGRVDAASPPAVADVGLPAPQGVPVGGLGEPAGVDADGFLVDAQELLDRSLGLLVVALAEVVEADSAVAIDEVQGGPVAVRQRLPDGEVVVDDDRVVDAQLAGRMTHVVEVVLEAELGAVHADDDEPAVAVPLGPRSDVRQRPQPVDARVRPDVDEDDAPAQLLGRERLGVQPDGRAVERREVAVDGVGGGHVVLLGG